jgi:anhydro-N-acetylmuramic acid kinase
MADSYNVLGLMSGTSLDGLDIAHCIFSKEAEWGWKLLECETVPYDQYWQKKLGSAHHFSASQLCQIDAELAAFHAQCVIEFLEKHKLQIDFISSHGHTVLHNPAHHYTCQISSGAIISANTGNIVISDFRTKDVALGGQGAPLVPGGEFILFKDYDGFLNLGGIANLSLSKEGNVLAYDICTCNMLLNACASLQGIDCDIDGNIAARGNVIPELLIRLNNNDYYNNIGPASIGKEFFENYVWPETKDWHSNHCDLLRTAVEHVALQISKRIPLHSKILASGGGVLNKFLFSRLQEICSAKIIAADQKLISFKEALVFAFLGVLRWRGENNCLKQVTGAVRDHCSGAVYLP